jgi:hypothetical protein
VIKKIIKESKDKNPCSISFDIGSPEKKERERPSSQEIKKRLA